MTAGAAALAGCQIHRPGFTGTEDAVGGDAADPAKPVRWLLPVGNVTGGFSLAPAPVAGFWIPPPGPFVTLRYPVAAAARWSDVYLVDAGLNRVYHYDTMARTLRPMLGQPGGAGMKLCVLPDASVMVLDPLAGRLVRYSREGVRISDLRGEALLAGASDVAVDDRSDTTWIADGINARVIAVRPALNAMVPFPLVMPGGEPPLGQLVALAAGGGVLYALDAGRSRVLRIDPQGRVLQSFGEGLLRLPHALAVDRGGRVFVADRFDQTLHLFVAGKPLAVIAAAALGAAEIRDLRVHDDDLVIADALGAKALLFRLLFGGTGR